jgi:hypothetical protein
MIIINCFVSWWLYLSFLFKYFFKDITILYGHGLISVVAAALNKTTALTKDVLKSFIDDLVF